MRENEAVVYKFISNILNKQPDDFISELTDDVEIHVCLGNQLYTDSYAATFIGKNGAQNLFNLCKQFLSIESVTPTDFHQEGEKLIVRGDLKCHITTSKAPWNSSWMQIWTFDKDHVVKLRMFADYHPYSKPIDTEIAANPMEEEALDTLQH